LFAPERDGVCLFINKDKYMIKLLILTAVILFSSILIFNFSKMSKFRMAFLKSPSVLAADAQNVILSWDRPNDARVAGYKIFYGSVNTNFKSDVKKVIHSPAQTSCEIVGLEIGRTYGFAAKSINGKGDESIFSDVLYYDVSEMEEENHENVASAENHSSSSGGGCFINYIRR